MKNPGFDHWSTTNEVTEDAIEYYRKNPEELDLIVDKESFHKRFLYVIFFFGLSMTIGARVLSVVFKGVWEPYLNDLVLDLMGELGIAIFGGAVTAYFIEFLKNKQYKQNIAYRNQIKRAIEERTEEK